MGNSLSAYSGTPFVVTFPSNGIIDFANDPNLTITSPTGISLGDLNGDGKPDLAINSTNSLISIYRNVSSASGSLSFVLVSSLAVSANNWGISLIDFDGDGKLDLASVDYSSNYVRLFRNTTRPPDVLAKEILSNVRYKLMGMKFKDTWQVARMLKKWGIHGEVMVDCAFSLANVGQ